MKRAVIYARVSTKEQDTNYSIPSQIEGAKEYARRHELEVVGIYREDASGLRYPRPELEKALQAIEDRLADVVIVHTEDRLNRHEINGFLIRKRISDAKAELHYTLTGECDLSDEYRMFSMIKDAIAANEARTIIERTMRGKRQKVKAGAWLGVGTPPYGYRAVGRGPDAKLEIYEEEARWVRKIYEWYVEGVTVSKIAEKLRLHGVQRAGMTRQQVCDSPPCAWSEASIYNILKSETYAGRYHSNKRVDKKMPSGERVYSKRPREEWIEVRVPAIVDQSLFDRAQVKLARGRADSARNRKYNALLAKRVTCGSCGYKMTTTPLENGRRMYYKCYSHRRQHVDSKKCKSPYFKLSLVDDAIWNCVKNILQNPEALRVSVERAKKQSQQDNSHIHESIRAIDEEIKRQNGRLTRAVELYLESDGFTKQIAKKSQEESEALLRHLHKERDELGKRVVESEISSDTLDAVEDYIRGIRDELDGLEFEERRAVIEALDAQVRLVLEGDQKVAYLTLLFQTYRVDIETNSLSSYKQRDSSTKLLTIPLTFRLVLAA